MTCIPSRIRECVENPWDQRSEVFQSVADGNQYQYRDLETGDVQLMREISVARHKNVKIGRGECEQFAILLAGPPHPGSSPYVMADELAL